jgi:hypothetical protein
VKTYAAIEPMRGLHVDPSPFEQPVPSWPSTAYAYNTWVSALSGDVVAVKTPAEGVAARHDPCQVSAWVKMPCTGGAIGANALAALSVKVGVAESATSPARGEIVVFSGIVETACSVNTRHVGAAVVRDIDLVRHRVHRHGAWIRARRDRGGGVRRPVDHRHDIGFRVHKKVESEATLRVYPPSPARYPLLNPTVCWPFLAR